MSKPTLLLLFFILNCFDSNAQFEWQNFSNPGVVYDMHFEDEAIWVSSQGALFSFDTDGERQIFQPDNSPLKGIGVNDIVSASDGSIFFGSRTAGLFNLENQNWTQYRDIGLTQLVNHVRRIDTYNDGFWLLSQVTQPDGTKSLLVNFENDTFTDHSEKFPEPIIDFVSTNKNEIWLRSFNTLYLFDGEDQIEIIDSETVPFLANRNIVQMEKDDSGNLYLFTQVVLSPELGFSVIKYTGDTWHLFFPTFGSTNMVVGEDQNMYLAVFNQENYEQIAKLNELEFSFIDSSIIQLIPNQFQPRLKSVDKDGRFWFHTSSEEKIYGVLDNDVETLDLELDNLSSNYPNDITEDCDGNIIVADNFDFRKYINEEWSITSLVNQSRVTEIFTDPQSCDTWFSTFFSSGTELFQYTGNELIEHLNGGFGGAGIDISENGNIVFGSIANGLGIYDSNEWTWFDNSNSPINTIEGLGSIITDVKTTKDGSIWLIQLDDILLRYLNDEWTSYDLDFEPNLFLLNRLYEDNQNNLWTWNGNKLFEYSNGSWLMHYIPFPNISVTSVVQDESSNYWISTTTHGLLRWDKSEYTIYNVDNSNIGTNYIEQVYLDQNENLWCLNNVGISTTKISNINSTNQQNIGESNKIYISPNPAANSIFVSQNSDEQFKYKIYSSKGDLVDFGEIYNSESINIEGLSNGLYILQISVKGEVNTVRFVKMSN